MKRFFHRAINKTNKLENAKSIATVYYWPPVDLFGNRQFHPISGYMKKGNLGHISLLVKYENGKTDYVSVWERREVLTGDGYHADSMRAHMSDSLETDIQAEDGRIPAEKSVELSKMQAQTLEEHIEALKQEFAKEMPPYPMWDFYNNCSNFVFDALEKANLTYKDEAKLFPMTPNYVFERSFKEQSIDDIEVKRLKSLSHSSSNQE